MVQELNLKDIIDRCAQEARQQRAQEHGYCFELFRRAIEQQDQAAWTALDRQYRQLMMGWAQAYPTGGQTVEDVDGTVQEALERFWRTLAKRGISSNFAHVGALLKYLRQCVIATILDQQRRRQRRERLLERLASAPEALLTQHSFEETTLAELARSEQIERVRRWISEEVRDPQEQRILALSYEEELNPTEIAARFPTEFENAATVRRIKERVLKRARRALAE